MRVTPKIKKAPLVTCSFPIGHVGLPLSARGPAAASSPHGAAVFTVSLNSFMAPCSCCLFSSLLRWLAPLLVTCGLGTQQSWERLDTTWATTLLLAITAAILVLRNALQDASRPSVAGLTSSLAGKLAGTRGVKQHRS